MIVWLTGLPCSGKTTLGRAVSQCLTDWSLKSVLLDGDEVRARLWPELGFTRLERNQNVQRFGHLAGMLSSHGIIAVVSAVSPYRTSRDEMRGKAARFIEVFVNCPLEVCEARDVKGMYAKARAGELPGFTGVSSPYEPPFHPDVECRTDLETVGESVVKIMKAISEVKIPHA
jgi:adenylyl-sulfate kinase